MCVNIRQAPDAFGREFRERFIGDIVGEFYRKLERRIGWMSLFADQHDAFRGDVNQISHQFARLPVEDARVVQQVPSFEFSLLAHVVLFIEQLSRLLRRVSFWS
jgi:hypothetical protein